MSDRVVVEFGREDLEMLATLARDSGVTVDDLVGDLLSHGLRERVAAALPRKVAPLRLRLLKGGKQ